MTRAGQGFGGGGSSPKRRGRPPKVRSAPAEVEVPVSPPERKPPPVAGPSPKACIYRDPRTGAKCGAASDRQYCPAHRLATLPLPRGPLAHTTLRVAPGSRNGRRGS